MTIVERLKNRLEEIREENRTPIMRQRSFDAQANSLFFEAGYEAAIKEMERAFCEANEQNNRDSKNNNKNIKSR